MASEGKDCKCDLLVIDEASMLSVELTAELLSSMEENARRVLLVGDPDQLPSIGAGNVLRDLLQATNVKRVQLKKIMRQEGTGASAIITNATNVREGRELEVIKGGGVYMNYLTEDKQVGLLDSAFKDRIPKLTKEDGMPMDPLMDVQVIVPQYAGPMGCDALNQRLQTMLNPASSEKVEWTRGTDAPTKFREGDKVMVTKNDRQSEVTNGEIGILDRIDMGKNGINGMTVDFAGKKVKLAGNALNNITLGYAITVHKSQGSEAPMVVTVFNGRTSMALRQRNLLYTVITRPKERLWVITDNRQVLTDCISNNNPELRSTRLGEWLQTLPAPRFAAPKFSTDDLPLG
jgi:exodeoxyribonuclease V alpha subunit